MKKFRVGLKQVIIEIILGFLTPVILKLPVYTGLVPKETIIWIDLIIVVLNIIMIFSMRSWGIIYTLGWLLGSFVFMELGLLDTLSILLYIAAPIALLALRLVLFILKPLRK
jgi:hypothetical protein